LLLLLLLQPLLNILIVIIIIMRGPAELDETRLVVRGALDMATIGVLDRTIASFEGRLLEIEVSGVSSFGSKALAVFVRALRRNPVMRVVACSLRVLCVLEVTDTLALLTGQHTARNVSQRASRGDP
jgi:ABC-type transporter Mla MlaB component